MHVGNATSVALAVSICLFSLLSIWHTWKFVKYVFTLFQLFQHNRTWKLKLAQKKKKLTISSCLDWYTFSLVFLCNKEIENRVYNNQNFINVCLYMIFACLLTNTDKQIPLPGPSIIQSPFTWIRWIRSKMPIQFSGSLKDHHTNFPFNF